MDDNTIKLLIDSLNKNIEIIRREIICKVDDSNLRAGENFHEIKAQLKEINESLGQFVSKEDCKKKTEDGVQKEEFKYKKVYIICSTVSGIAGIVAGVFSGKVF